MSIIERYQKLSPHLQSQLKRIAKHFSQDVDVRKCYNSFVHSEKDIYEINDSAKEVLLHMAILETVDIKDFFEPRWFKHLYCYSDDRPLIKLSKVLKNGKHACVVEGKFDNVPVVIKWYKSLKRDIRYESGIYSRLKEMGCPVPKFITSYRYMGEPVLILEKLSSLSAYDDEYRLGVELIKQLKHVHKFGVHCDIKPQNVMKRYHSDIKKRKYLLIDYGGVATDQLKHGYRRWIWSPKWTSQPAHEKNQIATPKNDFLELGYTMKAIQNWRYTKGNSDGDVKSDFNGKLGQYMKRVDRIKHDKISDNDYTDLIKILKS